MKSKIILAIIGLVIFGVGFFSGSEYTKYQVRTAFENVFTGNNTVTPSKEENSVEKTIKAENLKVHDQNIGDVITFSTLTLQVNNVKEEKTISSSYSQPKVAKEGAKFVVVDLTVKNITKSPFSFRDDMTIVDNQKREFNTYDDTIGSIENYLDMRDLAPNIQETGVVVYELPEDAVNYSMVIGKDGTKDVYKITLK